MTSPLLPPFKVLLFSRTLAYRHDSIPAGIRAIAALSTSSPSPKFTVDATEDPTVFTPLSLAQYRVVILLQCSGEFLEPHQLDALKEFVHSGGGVVGIHCTSFAMESSEWYGRMIGAVFESHPAPEMQKVWVVDPGHPIVKESLKLGCGMREAEGEQWEWNWKDEWYRYKGGTAGIRERTKVLLAGGDLGRENPISWCQEFEGGRSFYTSLGHFDEAYEDEGFMAQVLGGILWAAGTC